MKYITPNSAAQHRICVGRVSAAETVMFFGNGDRLLFLAQGIPTAVETGGFVYACDGLWTSAFTRCITRFAEKVWEPKVDHRVVSPVVRVAPEQFDFLVGAVLTKAGLPLTRRET